MAAQLKINRETVRICIKNKLHLFPYRRQKVHYLNNDIRKKRVERCKRLKHRLAGENLANVLWSDEKIFTIEEATNRQNDRILARDLLSIPEHLRFVDRNHFPLSVMIWVGITQNFKTEMVFVPKGMKINSTTYRQLILETEVKKMSENHKIIYQQDGAPAHTSNVTQKWCRDHLDDFLDKTEWPPSSPYLNPLDFCVWGYLEAKVCTKSHTSLESLKASILKEWTNFPQQVLRAAVTSVPSHLSKIINAKGGHIE